MPCRVNRRQWLISGLGAAGAMAVAPHSATARAETDRLPDAPGLPVSIERCESFEPGLLRRRFDAMLDRIGGVKRLVENKTVTVKINLTGLQWKPAFGLPAYETYQTHPHTVAVLAAIFADSGAKRIVFVENAYWDRPFETTLIEAGWDVKGIQSAGAHRVTFEDTRNRGRWPGYSRFKVPWGGFVFPAFDLNMRFEKTDVLVSLAKLKQHACAGVTGAIKNFFGNAPTSLYGNDAPSENPKDHRTEMFHDGGRCPPAGVPAPITDTIRGNFRRVPNITADIYGARPADLSVVDGIRTISGGEGHWNGGIQLREPKLILAGRNGVCVDAISAAVMGFDPLADHGQWPFPGDNHLKLLASVGVGAIDPKRIEVRGLPLAKAVHPFAPPPEKKG
jgi:uncharacterized protein (DUF362 family)